MDYMKLGQVILCPIIIKLFSHIITLLTGRSYVFGIQQFHFLKTIGFYSVHGLQIKIPTRDLAIFRALWAAEHFYFSVAHQRILMDYYFTKIAKEIKRGISHERCLQESYTFYRNYE